MSQNILDYRLSVAGQDVAGAIFVGDLPFADITDKIRPRLISLGLSGKRGGEADQLDLTLDDADGRLALPRTGADIRLAFGWRQGSGVRTGLVDKGRFTVDEVEWSGAPGIVTIRARAANLTGKFRIRRERSWKDTTIGDVVRELADANGYEPRIDAALAAIPVPVLVQHNTSDMALLRRLGKNHDAVATVKDGKLIFLPVGKSKAAGGAPLASILLVPAMGSGFRLRFVDRGAGAGVEARWHDRAQATRKSVTVGAGKSGKPKRLRRVYNSEASARAAAEAENKRTKRRGGEFEMTLALGRADLFPETPVTLSGFKDEADAVPWIVSEVSHAIDRGGFRTTVKLERN